MHEEEQYLNLLKQIIDFGDEESGRNGTTISLFGSQMRFSLQSGIIPFLTTKKLAWKTCLRELLWFIRGSTDGQALIDQGVKIWAANGSREFLDASGLVHLPENDLGPIYGHQWRHFNAPYQNCKTNYDGKGVDQLQNIINCLKDPAKRTSRRLVMSAWNPCQIEEMALPPCHVLVQFNVSRGNLLSAALYQRSGDMGLGVPFNIASYSMLLSLLAKHCDLIAHEFVYFLGNAHIYSDHIEPVKKQMTRVPFPFPKINIREKREKIEDYTVDDFEIIDYTFHENITMNMHA